MEKRSIPLKNYIIFTIISLLSFLFVFNLSRWYKENKPATNILNKTIKEVLPQELESFLTENGTVVIYLTNSNDDALIDFEKDFKNYIIEKQIENDIFYYDLSKDENNIFRNKLDSDNFYPNLYMIKDHEFSSKLFLNKTNITIDQIEVFLTTNEVLETND